MENYVEHVVDTSIQIWLMLMHLLPQRPELTRIKIKLNIGI